MYDYELFSIMIHSGGAMGGHYFAYVKDLESKARPLVGACVFGGWEKGVRGGVLLPCATIYAPFFPFPDLT